REASALRARWRRTIPGSSHSRLASLGKAGPPRSLASPTLRPCAPASMAPSRHRTRGTRPASGETAPQCPVHHADELDRGFNRTSDSVHVEEAVEAVVSRRPLAAVVNAERHVEPLDLIVDRPERL